MFGIGELILAAVISVRCKSFPAIVGCIALIATMSLRWIPVEFIPYATAIWAAAGATLITRGNYLIGWLYGLSGVCYLLAYIDQQDTRYALMHLMSDFVFLFGLGVIAWPKGGNILRRFGGRYISWGGSEKMAADMGRNSKADWGAQ
jgi:hypothetical protein